MNHSIVLGSVLGVAVATAGAGGGYMMIKNTGPEYAPITSVETVTETRQVPREECRDEVVTHQNAPRDPNKVAGTAVGAIIGGVLGNQIGDGSGRKLATVAGAVAGGVAGNRVQGEMQKNDTYTMTEQRCVTVYDTQQVPAGFSITYELDGETHTVHADKRPDRDRFLVQDGQIVLDSAYGDAGAEPARGGKG